jgi:hypothetical protein
VGKMCVSVGSGRIMCRIDPEIHDAALEPKGCTTVVMKGREYRGYVRVDADALSATDDLDYWINLALDAVRYMKAFERYIAENGYSDIPLDINPNTPNKVRDFIRRHADMLFHDVHCMLRLPIPAQDLGAGCNFAAGTYLLDLGVISPRGAFFLLAGAGASVPRWRKQTQFFGRSEGLSLLIFGGGMCLLAGRDTYAKSKEAAMCDYSLAAFEIAWPSRARS